VSEVGQTGIANLAARPQKEEVAQGAVQGIKSGGPSNVTEQFVR
jgi:hypothetical protein